MMEDRVVVSVIDRDERDRRRATVLEDTAAAQRLVEALIVAGCDERDVSVFRGREVGMQVVHQVRVHLGFNGGAGASWSAPEVPADPTAWVEPGGGRTVAAAPTTGGWGIHIRADRFVWMCLWAVSIVVLVASLLTSLSRPAPREFVPGTPL